jgi:hypothetical protein
MGCSTGAQLTQAQRVELFRAAVSDPRLLDGRGYAIMPFASSLARLSPLTRNHKLLYAEAEIVGSDVGDGVGRVYVVQSGTGVVQGVANARAFYRFPERTAVLNSFFNGARQFAPEVYRNEHLRDRPYANTSWELILNQADERANQDINLRSLTDIRLYLYYTDFTAF